MFSVVQINEKIGNLDISTIGAGTVTGVISNLKLKKYSNQFTTNTFNPAIDYVLIVPMPDVEILDAHIDGWAPQFDRTSLFQSDGIDYNGGFIFMYKVQIHKNMLFGILFYIINKRILFLFF